MFYRQYIDNLIFIWAGSDISLINYLEYLNSNENNIKLTSQWSKDQINSLDVNIFRHNYVLETKIYSKPTDRNRILPIQSGHYPLWLKNIPKGQIMRVRRNCSTADDLVFQSEVSGVPMWVNVCRPY